MPEPVIFLAIKPKNPQDYNKFAKVFDSDENPPLVTSFQAISRFMREDPTFRSYQDTETNETIIQVMFSMNRYSYNRLVAPYRLLSLWTGHG